MVWRSMRLDARIAAEFARREELDKGPMPYFVDTMHPPVYDGGVRVEGPVDAGEEEGGYNLEEEHKGEEHDLEEEHKPEQENKLEEEHVLEGMDTPSKAEEMMDEQIKGTLKVVPPHP